MAASEHFALTGDAFSYLSPEGWQAPEVLDVVIPTGLRVGESYGQIPAQSGFYTSRQLLDAVYGIASREKLVRRRCNCDSANVQASPSAVNVHCPKCRFTDRGERLNVPTGDEWDFEHSVKLGGIRYLYRNGGWWAVPRKRDDLLAVTSSQKCAELDKRSGRDKLTKSFVPMKDDPTEHFEWRKMANGTVRRHKVRCEPDCYCESDDADLHDAFAVAGMLCPRHGATCGTCGENHFSAVHPDVTVFG